MKKRADDLSDTESISNIQDKGLKARSKKSVIIYMTTLFMAVVLFILLSYFIQQRNNTEINALNEMNTTAEQNIENLQDSNVQLQSENESYKQKIAELESQVTALESELSTMKQETMQSQQAAGNQQTVGTAG
jgi:predicted PurR-regulated permease PerM